MTLAHRLERTYTGAVYDTLRAMGHANCVLPATIRPIDSGFSLAGPVWTVSGHYEEGLDPHETLLGWTTLLSKAPKGHVVVCQPNDSTIAHMGELSAETLKLRGVLGYIVDGGTRDVDFIRRIGFRVFCRYNTPLDIVGRWIPDSYGAAIEIGGVSIKTGDFVLADNDGVVVVPKRLARKAVDETEKVLRTESLMRRALLDGMDPVKAYRKWGKF
jgi:4-hydroxy-4-methyl-2-oxoglutarate aldolase